mmetsp:Transcript_3162/g.5629  ORF Transcript_3162/g.5629 Transcript_3162/m.5629 type:complete len:280 (-) Transcript_3162:581-1420(-)
MVIKMLLENYLFLMPKLLAMNALVNFPLNAFGNSNPEMTSSPDSFPGLPMDTFRLFTLDCSSTSSTSVAVAAPDFSTGARCWARTLSRADTACNLFLAANPFFDPMLSESIRQSLVMASSLTEEPLHSSTHKDCTSPSIGHRRGQPSAPLTQTTPPSSLPIIETTLLDAHAMDTAKYPPPPLAPSKSYNGTTAETTAPSPNALTSNDHSSSPRYRDRTPPNGDFTPILPAVVRSTASSLFVRKSTDWMPLSASLPLSPSSVTEVSRVALEWSHSVTYGP